MAYCCVKKCMRLYVCVGILMHFFWLNQLVSPSLHPGPTAYKHIITHQHGCLFEITDDFHYRLLILHAGDKDYLPGGILSGDWSAWSEGFCN